MIGATDDRQELDRSFLSAALSGTPLPATLHRAFDTLADIGKSVCEAIELGFERILTSGQAAKADQGLEGLKAAVACAAGRISIMAGSGVSAGNAMRLLKDAHVDELHASCSSPSQAVAPGAAELRLGFMPSTGTRSTDAELVRALRDAMNHFREAAE
ncbi:copper homeostasis protein CutC [Roseibium salinum]|nr:copper homeostasis protein CutC [Roseibium salinum]